ncbi:MAG: hypothetical protein IPK22_26165 [Verrucomicrobiaceae bacterium]|nr:hypothetical protein [Verrucomicrobiaceae bacterium]
MTKLEDTDEASARVWSALPGFQWYAPALRAKAGSEVIVIHGKNRISSAASRSSSRRLAAQNLHGHRWGVALAQRRRRQISLPLLGSGRPLDGLPACASSGDRCASSTSPDRPRTGDAHAERERAGVTGELPREGAVIAQIAAPSGKVSSVAFSRRGSLGPLQRHLHA